MVCIPQHREVVKLGDAAELLDEMHGIQGGQAEV
jgi:hypothetical protein